jgi:hypothetical protein
MSFGVLEVPARANCSVTSAWHGEMSTRRQQRVSSTQDPRGAGSVRQAGRIAARPGGPRRSRAPAVLRSEPSFATSRLRGPCHPPAPAEEAVPTAKERQ